MAWTIVTAPDYDLWFAAESTRVQLAIVRRVARLEVDGPQLGRPAVDAIRGSALANLKELRVPVAGEPYRILFAFDPRRQAILLVGGTKAGDERWYIDHIPIAEARFGRHLERLEAEDEAKDKKKGKP